MILLGLAVMYIFRYCIFSILESDLLLWMTFFNKSWKVGRSSYFLFSFLVHLVGKIFFFEISWMDIDFFMQFHDASHWPWIFRTEIHTWLWCNPDLSRCLFWSVRSTFFAFSTIDVGCIFVQRFQLMEIFQFEILVGCSEGRPKYLQLFVISLNFIPIFLELFCPFGSPILGFSLCGIFSRVG